MSDKHNAAYHGADFEEKYFEAAAKLAEVRSINAEGATNPEQARQKADRIELLLTSYSDSAALERREKAVAERAWDEGFEDGASQYVGLDIETPVTPAPWNPYRTPPAASTEESDRG